jgi:ABC-2 type transport system ATP-binding protein
MASVKRWKAPGVAEGEGMEEPIRSEMLGRRFGDLDAVKDVSLTVRRGEMFGLLGPNGAGKSTLLKLLTGQLQATSGSCRVQGIDPAKDPIAVKRAIGIVPELESPPSFLTGREYLHFVGLVRGIEDIEPRAEHWLDFLDMTDSARTPCKDLSKGTRQKLMIAAALIHEPSLVFLDEPFSGLDPKYQRILREYLAGYLAKGGTAFMCTHILEIAEKVCTRVAIIDHGRIVAVGRPDAIGEKGERLEEAFLRLTDSAGP